MKIFALILALSSIGFISTQATQLEILKAWNYARQNPSIFLAQLDQKFAGKTGIPGDESCYTSARTALQSQKPIGTLSEDVGLDLASYDHSADLFRTVQKLQHEGSNGSKPEDRLKKYGYFFGKYTFFEMLAYTKQTAPVAANDVILLLITDCGVPDRSHRRIIFDTEITHFGAGVFYQDQSTYYTIMGSKGYTRKEVANSVLATARIEGDGLYTGNGSNQPIAEWRKAEFFQKTGNQIHTEASIEKADDTTGVLGDLKDDKSVECPQFINFSLLQKSLVRDWTLSSVKCERGKLEFTSTSNLDRTLPFAKASKCYHRLKFCDTNGRVWTKDREYKTLKEYNPQTETQVSILKATSTDGSVTCPTWINTNLRKRIFQDTYMSGEKCTRGNNGFDESGYIRIPPFAFEKKCYQRLKFCDDKGIVWLKDSEYKTLDEYKASQE